MFTDNFDSFAIINETISCKVDGFDIEARIHEDDYSIDDDDCHNVDQEVMGCTDKVYVKLMAARQAWQDGEWFYCGIVLSVSKNGIELDDHASALWAIECNYPGSDNSRLLEVANELLPEALEAGKAILKKLTD